MPNSFGSRANIAAFNVDFNILMQHRPIILSSNQLLGLVNLKMVYKKIVMILTDQLRSNNFRDVKKVLILEHSLNIFSYFKKLYSLQFSCLIVVFFQIWESEPHGSNNDIVRVFVSYLASKKVLKPLQLR